MILDSSLYADSPQARRLDERMTGRVSAPAPSWDEDMAIQRRNALAMAARREADTIAMRKRIAGVCDDLAKRLGMPAHKEAQ